MSGPACTGGAIRAATRLREVELRHGCAVLCCCGGGTGPGLQLRRGPAAGRHGRAARVQQRVPVPAALLRRQRRLRSAATLDASEPASCHGPGESARPRPRSTRGGAWPRRRIARRARARRHSAARGVGGKRAMAVLAAWSEAAATGDNGERVAVGPPMGRPALASSSSESTWQRSGGREKPQSARRQAAGRARAHQLL